MKRATFQLGWSYQQPISLQHFQKLATWTQGGLYETHHHPVFRLENEAGKVGPQERHGHNDVARHCQYVPFHEGEASKESNAVLFVQSSSGGQTENKLGMTMVQFRMKNTLVNCHNKFYVYQGAAKGHDLSEEDVVLAIGSFESAFFVDLVVSFIFEKWQVVSNHHCFGRTIGMMGWWCLKEGEQALETPQCRGQEGDATTHLSDKGREEEDGKISKALWKKVAAQDSEWFPFLDMRMRWQRDRLEFRVYQKENQLLKYVDKQSTHHPSTFSSFTIRVLTRLCRLTSQDFSLGETQVDKIYPEHAEVLHKAGLAPELIPTFREIWKKDDGRLVEKKKKQRDLRTTCFVLGYSQFFHDAEISKLLKHLRQYYRLKWLHISMVYRRYP
eukprot:15364905-Ditylum_brightwellii.AAC.1